MTLGLAQSGEVEFFTEDDSPVHRMAVPTSGSASFSGFAEATIRTGSVDTTDIEEVIFAEGERVQTLFGQSIFNVSFAGDGAVSGRAFNWYVVDPDAGAAVEEKFNSDDDYRPVLADYWQDSERTVSGEITLSTSTLSRPALDGSAPDFAGTIGGSLSISGPEGVMTVNPTGIHEGFFVDVADGYAWAYYGGNFSHDGTPMNISGFMSGSRD